jgi:hypothetical protein
MINYCLGCLLAWAPKLHGRYSKTLQAILENDPKLTPNFNHSVFACATLNLGPKTVCFRHKDHGNLPYGWCGVTTCGDFDYTKGGHLILWELGLVLEFPPGCTILLPSACISHSNVAIGSSETRYSFTQYTAGAIFRWVDNGCKLDDDFWSGLSDEQVVEEKRKRGAHFAEGLSLLRNLP